MRWQSTSTESSRRKPRLLIGKLFLTLLLLPVVEEFRLAAQVNPLNLNDVSAAVGRKIYAIDLDNRSD
jgi:hypothetical protein